MILLVGVGAPCTVGQCWLGELVGLTSVGLVDVCVAGGAEGPLVLILHSWLPHPLRIILHLLLMVGVSTRVLLLLLMELLVVIGLIHALLEGKLILQRTVSL